MPKKFMPDLSDEERIRVMRENAEKVEDTTFLRELSPEELDIKRELFVDNSIRVSQLEDELDVYKEKYKGQIKPIKSLNGILQEEIKIKKSKVKGTLFHMPNYEDQVVEIYDEKGDFISSRRMTPEEKQRRVPFLKRAASE